MTRRIAWLAVYAAAMAYLEAAVVVYLRELYYPAGFTFPLVPLPAGMMSIEIAREMATVVMILGVAVLAGVDRWERFLHFSFVFGIWDILFYVWLYIMIGWPASLTTPDILFLIPVPWVSPVLAPIVISLGLVAGSLLLLGMRRRGAVLAFPWSLWALALAGGILVLLSFTLDFRGVLAGGPPPPFRWGLFGAGAGAGAAAFATGVLRLRSMIVARART